MASFLWSFLSILDVEGGYFWRRRDHIINLIHNIPPDSSFYHCCSFLSAHFIVCRILCVRYRTINLMNSCIWWNNLFRFEKSYIDFKTFNCDAPCSLPSWRSRVIMIDGILLPIARNTHDKNGVKLYSNETKLRNKIGNWTEQGWVWTIFIMRYYTSFSATITFLHCFKKFDFNMLPSPHTTLPMQPIHYADRTNAEWLIRLCHKFKRAIGSGWCEKSQFHVGKPGII